jgi:hypothetical protein
MTKEYSLICAIICDDVRKEDNGKDILIGVYGDMSVDRMPAVLPTMGLHFQARIEKTRFDKVEASIKNPDGQPLVKLNGTLEFSNTKSVATFNFKFGPVLLAKTGNYEIYLGMDDEPTLVRTLKVSTPESAA